MSSQGKDVSFITVTMMYSAVIPTLRWVDGCLKPSRQPSERCISISINLTSFSLRHLPHDSSSHLFVSWALMKISLVQFKFYFTTQAQQLNELNSFISWYWDKIQVYKIYNRTYTKGVHLIIRNYQLAPPIEGVLHVPHSGLYPFLCCKFSLNHPTRSRNIPKVTNRIKTGWLGGSRNKQNGWNAACNQSHDPRDMAC